MLNRDGVNREELHTEIKQSRVLFPDFVCSSICTHHLFPYAGTSSQLRAASLCMVPNTALTPGRHCSSTGKYPGIYTLILYLVYNSYLSLFSFVSACVYADLSLVFPMSFLSHSLSSLFPFSLHGSCYQPHGCHGIILGG